MRKKGVGIQVNITRPQLEMIDAFVDEGMYESRSEFVRKAINRTMDYEIAQLKEKRELTLTLDDN